MDCSRSHVVDADSVKDFPGHPAPTPAQPQENEVSCSVDGGDLQVFCRNGNGDKISVDEHLGIGQNAPLKKCQYRGQEHSMAMSCPNCGCY